MIVALNLPIRGANNKHSFEINIAKRIDHSLDKSRLRSLRDRSLAEAAASVDCIERCWQGEARPTLRRKNIIRFALHNYYAS
jgi:hypothetical protein